MGVWTNTSMHSFTKHNIRETLASLFRPRSVHKKLEANTIYYKDQIKPVFDKSLYLFADLLISLRTKTHNTMLEKIAFYSIY